MSEHDDLAQRLAELGSASVPDGVRTDHLHAMRASSADAVAPRSERRRFGRLAVAGAALVGFAAGSTGFAMAGALPGPAQGIAHDVLSVVQIEVPDEGWRNRGECVSAHARAGDEAGKAGCPQGGPPAGVPGGGPPDGAPGRGEGMPPGQVGKAPHGPNADDDPCTGKPPWAGPMSPEARAAAKASCPDRADLDEEAEELEEPTGS